MFAVGSLTGFMAGNSLIAHKIAANVSNFNIASTLNLTAAYGSIEIEIPTGVTVNSASAGVPAFVTGTLPASIIKWRVHNKGDIKGAGGNGGKGGDNGNHFGAAGSAGGHAISVSSNGEVFNDGGKIWGGGGGGSGGVYGIGPGCNSGCGGGGGGGAGDTVGIGIGPGTDTCSGNQGGTGSNGTATAGGAGGSGQPIGPPSNGGGAGGAPGAAGSAGGGPNCLSQSSPAGGAAGKAIALNGNTVVLTGDTSDPNVKGAVS